MKNYTYLYTIIKTINIMKNSLSQRFQNLKTEVINNIRSMVTDKIEFDEKPVFTESIPDEGVCGSVEVDYIIKKENDIFVFGINDQSEEEVEINIVDIELKELINICIELEKLH